MDLNQIAASYGVSNFMLITLLIWILVWKAWALWISARAGSKGWFIALIVVNTLGILEILYIFIFSKRSGGGESEETLVVEETITEIER